MNFNYIRNCPHIVSAFSLKCYACTSYENGECFTNPQKAYTQECNSLAVEDTELAMNTGNSMSQSSSSNLHNFKGITNWTNLNNLR